MDADYDEPGRCRIADEEIEMFLLQKPNRQLLSDLIRHPPTTPSGCVDVEKFRAPDAARITADGVAPFVDGLLFHRSATPLRFEFTDTVDAGAWYQRRRSLVGLLGFQEYDVISIPNHLRGAELAAALAHEYTHHHQTDFPAFMDGKNQYIIEGHATGVEWLFLRANAPDGNALVDGMRLLKEAQHQLAIRRDAFLNRIDDVQHRDARATYAIGHALFAIAEAKHGSGIYARALRDPRAVFS